MNLGGPAASFRWQTVDWREWPSVAKTWRTLADASPLTSIFLTADWVETWLHVFGPKLDPEIVIFYCGDEAIGCAVLVAKSELVGFVPLRRIYFNCAGEDQSDETAIEHNQFLVRPGHERAARDSLMALLGSRKWDQFIVAGTAQPDELAPNASHPAVVCRPDYYVDLEAIRNSGTPYENVLSANTRTQIRRCLKQYEANAQRVVLGKATTTEQALAWLDELREVHQRAWQQRGKKGVFSSVPFTKFHRDLVTRLFPKGNIMMLRIASGDTVIGLLYLLVHRGRVYYYQSGFRYWDDNRLKPGLLSHFLAIQHCLECPELIEYDFLAGESRYKRSLSREVRNMYWATYDRPTSRTTLLSGLRTTREFCLRATGRSYSSGGH